MSAHPRRLLSSWLSPCRSLLSGCSPGTATLASPFAGTDALERLSGRHQLVSRSSGTELGMRRGSSTTGTGIRVSVRMTYLLFLLGDLRHRQPRAVFKYWAQCRLCCVEIFFTVNNVHWFCHPRGTLLVLEAITMEQLTLALWVYAHFRAVWTTINSFSVSFVVMVSQMS